MTVDAETLRDSVATLLDRLSAIAVEIDSYPSPEAAKEAVFGVLNDFGRGLADAKEARRKAMSTSARSDRMRQDALRPGGDAFQGTSARVPAGKWPMDMSTALAKRKNDANAITKRRALGTWPMDMSADLAERKQAEREARKRRGR
jgi:hypothetical protein